MPKVSIIVPVYKVEKYIRECLDSILAQSFTDWECLLVDDDSPDNSGEICDEYAQKDARISVYHKENGGVSSARNLGLDKACGEWVMFVDSDDAIAENTLEICVHHAERENLDIVQFSFARDKRELGNLEGIDTDVLTREEYIKVNEYLVCVWGSLLRSDIIQSNVMRFDTSLKLAEDQMFIYNYMDHSERFVKVRQKLYWYRDTANSATSHQMPNDIEKSIKQLTYYKKEHPHWAEVIDKVMAGFLIDVILSKDATYQEMIDLTKKACLTNNSKLTGTYKVFYTISKVNIVLAILFVKIKYKFFK